MKSWDGIVRKCSGASVCALVAAVAGILLAGPAGAATSFNGTYTAVLKSAGKPDEVTLWNVSSICGFTPCLAHVVSKGLGSDWLFDGTQWSRLAVPQLGTCDGQVVPARSASQTLVPHPDGTLSGVVATSVDCRGKTVDVSETLALTPS